MVVGMHVFCRVDATPVLRTHGSGSAPQSGPEVLTSPPLPYVQAGGQEGVPGVQIFVGRSVVPTPIHTARRGGP